MNDTNLPSNRSFGLLFALVFSLVALWQVATKGIGTWAFLWFVCALTMLAITFLAPRVLTPFNRGWMKLGMILQKIVNPLVLGALYVVLIVPVGAVMRVVGRDALRIRKQEVESYWVPREERRVSAARFKNQF